MHQSGQEQYRPIDGIEYGKHDRNHNPARLVGHFGVVFVAPLEQRAHQDELADAEEDEEDADDHPDVEQRDVGDLWHVLADGAEHGGQREHRRHAHANPTCGDKLTIRDTFGQVKI